MQRCCLSLRMRVPPVYTALALAVDCWSAQWEGTWGVDYIVENMASIHEALGSTPLHAQRLALNDYTWRSRVYRYVIS